MKTMKSYRMDDTILGMMDYMKKEWKWKNDTQIIEYAIIRLWEYYKELEAKSEKPHENT